ncbi:MAG: hypothetical protein K5863_21015 [Nitratireductor sp.]|uniref:hypothetical protein n=1 Tax=Nitratireductor sp. TaxID=1872084 RepID=UPI0026049E71|nr:hypothetical protein [Nitratireductor sp.]MCV0352566.1 hypothetical protein [Nitratireductor sp.]
MDARQVALKVTLDRIGESDSIAGVDNRLRIQKAVYLAQAAGINLGYHYSWYIKGPYSTGLTQDYYQLAEALRSGDQSHVGKDLHPNFAAVLPRIESLLARPNGISVASHNWYEALASLHFLITCSKKDEDGAKLFLKQVKPHLSGVLDVALSRLKMSGLLA